MHIRKIKAGGVNTSWQNFVGEIGTLFYDQTQGNLRISDGHTPGGHPVVVDGVGGGSIVQSSTAPVAHSTSTLWYDTVGGRTYVYFDNNWIDSSPVPDLGTIWQLTSSTSQVSLNAYGALTFSNGATIQDYAGGFALNAEQGTGALIQIAAGGAGADGDVGGELRLWAGDGGDHGIRGTVDIIGDTTQIRNDLYTWTFSADGVLTVPGTLRSDSVTIEGAPVTITISDSGGVWGGAIGTYTRLGNVTPPTWAPANYNPSSDSSIAYNGSWQLNNPAFPHPVYVNTGTLFNPLATWDPDTQYNLGSGNPAGTYTYSPFNFASNGQLNLGTAQGQAGTYTNVVIQADSNVDSFAQIIHQNHSTGTNASTDIVLMNNQGDDFSNFIDLGINSTHYSQPSYSVTGPGDGYLFANGANLVIGTQSPNTSIKFHAGGTVSDDAVADFNEYRFHINRRMEVSVGTPSALTFLSQNTSNNVEASSSFVAQNNAGDYIKMGVNSSQRVDGSILQGESFIYTSQIGGTMHIGNKSSISFYANSTNGYLETPTVKIDNTTSNTIFDGNVIPYENLAYNLGTTSSVWNNLYVNHVAYTPATPSNWHNPPPTTIQQALDRLAAVVKTLNGGTGA